jgi:hypothetical protein
MIRRVLLSTINYDHPQRGLLQAFNGVFGSENVREFDFYEEARRGQTVPAINDAFVKAVIDHRPDWVFMQVQDSEILHADSILAIRKNLPGCVLSHWTGDCRPVVSPYLSSICKATHLTLVSSVGQLPMFKTAGAKDALYCQIAVDWEEDVNGNPNWTPPFYVSDVVLCGNHYQNRFPGTVDRESAVAALMEAKIGIGIVGRGWPKSFPVIGECKVKEQHHVWKQAKVALNVNHFNDIEQYYSDRQIIAMASGTPTVCKYVPGLEREFKNGVHCFWYDKPSELAPIVKQLLADEGLRKKVGFQGRAEIMKNHTWFSRILSLLPEVERLKNMK